MRTMRRGSHFQYRQGHRIIGSAKPYQLVIVETPASYERRFRRLKPVSWPRVHSMWANFRYQIYIIRTLVKNAED